ncbi:MAG: hypothetical protein ABFS45_25340 [Pseudomonadota bacterium]
MIGLEPRLIKRNISIQAFTKGPETTDPVIGAAYKVHDRWTVMERLPKTPTGKLYRKALHLKANTEANS